MAKKSTSKPVQQTNRTNTTNTENRAWMPWAMAGLTFVVFAVGFRNGMVSMDDHSATVDNPAVKNFDLFGQFNLGMYAPVTWAGYGIAYILGKDNAFWYHLLSALVHALNVLVLFRLLSRMKIGETAVIVATFLFALHPIQVESVSWIAAFSTPLCALFGLLSMDFYIRSTTDTKPWNQQLLISIGLFLVACLSKSIAVSLPLTLLILDGWLKRPLNTRNLLEKAPYFIIALGFGALTLYSRTQAGHTDSVVVYSTADRFFMVFHTILFYWTKILLPYGFSIWYPFVKNGDSWPWTYYAAPFVFSAILFGAWRLRARMPFVWYGLLFYLANIVFALPFSTFGTFELRSDRYNYLAAIGIFTLLAMLPGYLKEQKIGKPDLVWGALVILMIACLPSTIVRIRHWHDTVSLIDSAIETTGDNFGKAYLWRGMEYGDRATATRDKKTIEQNVALSLKDLSQAIKINPGLTEAYKYRGGLYGVTQQYEKSLADITRYLTKNPNDFEFYYNRGLSLLNLNRVPEAINDFNKTLELDANFDRAYVARGNAYLILGDTVKGNADLEQYNRLTGGGAPAQ